MGQSAQQKAAGEASRTQAQLAGELWDSSKGPMGEIFRMLQGETAGGYNQTPGLVKQEFAEARTGTNLSYDSAIRANRELAGARAKTSGGVYSTGELDSAISQGTFALNQNRESAMRNLQFQEAQAGMGQWNNYLSLMGQGANSAIGLGQGFSGAGLGAVSQMSNSGGWGGALSGAASGAATGASIPGAGWYGAAIGGVIGGIGGYMS
jgi:hypothetical protein